MFIEVDLLETLEAPDVIKRTFRVRSTVENDDFELIGTTQMVEHVHYRKWPDNELPKTTEELDVLLYLAEKFAADHIRE